jgi:hypothetical protein
MIAAINGNQDSITRRCCRLLRPIRDHEGRERFTDQPEIIREIENLDRRMYLVRFLDGATTFVFPYEVEIVDQMDPHAALA